MRGVRKACSFRVFSLCTIGADVEAAAPGRGERAAPSAGLPGSELVVALFRRFERLSFLR
jgi:hypothetical protein